jgi:CRISPR-associated endonuclease/helicase Cas3
MPQRTHEENSMMEAGLEALELWPVPVVVCTAHTILGLFENVRRGIYAWPSIIKSVFIFDEVHAFSDRLFAYLLRFLKAFPGAPVFLMTATLPKERKNAIERICLERRGGIEIITGNPKRETAKRYVMYKVNKEDIWNKIDKGLDSEKKILWIVNTVKKSMHLFEEARKREIPVNLYHSRYRYKDRLKRHRSLIDSFDKNRPPVLGIATQVAEMSLDLSADILISEYAPIPAMIQRMGRLNRFDDEPNALGAAFFTDPGMRNPYDEESFTGVEQWLDCLCDVEPKSQFDLATEFNKIVGETARGITAAERCEWIDGLWESQVKRGIEEASFSTEIIRSEDINSGLPVENAIPMPFPHGEDWKSWKILRRYMVAPEGAVFYDELKGASWNVL